MTSEQPAHSSSSLLNAQKSRLDALEARIDTLLRVQKEQKPLIKDPSQLIAIAAFIISLMTTIYSWNRDRRQDEAALEIQLRDF